MFSVSELSVKNTFVHIEQQSESRHRRTASLPASMNFQAYQEIEQKFTRPSTLSVSTATPSLMSSASSFVSFTASEASSSLNGSADVSPVQPSFRTVSAFLRNMTTVMIRNIPCKYTQEYLMEEVSALAPNYDFLYMPPARRDGGSKGYAFVNFSDEDTAARFIEEFQGHTFFRQPNSLKRAEVLYAEVQGLVKNIKFFKKCKGNRSKFHPYINRAASRMGKRI